MKLSCKQRSFLIGCKEGYAAYKLLRNKDYKSYAIFMIKNIIELIQIKYNSIMEE